ncbi:MAG TPA: phosphatidylserine decarboxylase [Vicinamibacterales bacterium]|nr:phosphatidylserine decarboxylase [Vicinamibacterales bacterium]
MIRFDRAGYPFIAVALGLALVAAAAGVAWLAVVLLAFGGFFLFFFRDPDRVVNADANAVLSPADGRVLVAGPAAPGAAPEGQWQQISIFLSPMDVHVNRVPVSGRVTRVSYTPGRYLPAYATDAATANERSEIWIDHDGTPVVARQIVGMLARRVVCRVAVGTEVKAGDRYGVMKFGSRMDIFLPMSAEIRVEVGAMVRAAESVIAVLH